MEKQIILWNQAPDPHQKNQIVTNQEIYTDKDEEYEKLYDQIFNSNYPIISQKDNIVIYKKDFGKYVISGNYIETDIASRQMAFSARINDYPWSAVKKIQEEAARHGRHIPFADKLYIFCVLNKIMLIFIFFLSLFTVYAIKK